MRKHDDLPELLTVDEFRKHYCPHLGRNGAYDAIRRSELPSIKIGRRIFIPKAALMRMLDCE